MRKLSAALFLLFTSAHLGAQDLKIGSFVDILTHPALQKGGVEYAKETSKLEDLELQSKERTDCHTTPATQERSCEQKASELLPEHLRENGWQVLFEAKYEPTHDRHEGRSLQSTGSQTFDWNVRRVENYYEANPTEKLHFNNEQEMRIEAARIAALYPGSQAQEFLGPLLLNQLQGTKNYDEMMSRFRDLSKGLNDSEFTHLMTHFGGWVEYNYDRAKFKQTENAGLGVVSPFDMMVNGQGGICGDIHSMVAKFAEQRKWEAFTVGYALQGEQHVVTAMVNPNDPKKLMVVNYGRYEVQELNDGNSVMPVPTSPDAPGSAEIAMQMRIFKNKTPGQDGAMQHIATVPTPMGSFLRELHKREGHIERAMPENDHYQLIKVGARHQNSSTENLANGAMRERTLAHDIVVYEGKMDNAHVYGIAVSRDKFKTLYAYDPELGRCVKKRSGYFSLGLSGSIVDLPAAQLEQNYYIYLNMKGGRIHHIYETNYFQFKGLIGYELEALVAMERDSSFLTADGNFSTFAGVMAEYEKNGTGLYAGIKFENTVGLKNQNLMTDFSKLPGNISPLSFNAVQIDFGASRQLRENLTWQTNNQYTLTRVGARVLLSTGLVRGNSSLMLSYQGSQKPVLLKNSLQEVNLLQNLGHPDGMRLAYAQRFQFPNSGIQGQFGAHVGMGPSSQGNKGFFGGSVKINFRSPRR